MHKTYNGITACLPTVGSSCASFYSKNLLKLNKVIYNDAC